MQYTNFLHGETMANDKLTNTSSAVLMIAYGGPTGMDDVWPFLRNITGGRVPDARLKTVAAHYEHFDGISPLNELTELQLAGLIAELNERGYPLSGFLGMRFWQPTLPDTLAAMQTAGVKRAVGVIMAAQQSEPGWERYQSYLADTLREMNYPLDIAYTEPVYNHPQFTAAVAARVEECLLQLPAAEREQTRLVFTAHSIPLSDPTVERYVSQLKVCAKAVADSLNIADPRWRLVYQSRSGRPTDPWLEPDINDALRELAAEGITQVIVQPIGFVADHIEVLYDLDTEVAATARALGIGFQRAKSVNADAPFIKALADRVLAVLR